MSDKKEPSYEQPAEFPLPRNAPLSSQEVVKAVAGFDRKFQTGPEGKGDFPRKVRIKRKDGVEIETVLNDVFTDEGSQGDGTFYFSDNVRENSHAGNKFNYLFGREIETITFLE
jgi:hypothetical protein